MPRFRPERSKGLGLDRPWGCKPPKAQRGETVAVRIGSCFPEPKDHRMMVTWLSEDDLVSLIERVFLAQRVGYTTLYGVSDNLEKWWDNSHAGFLGWHPKDSSEQFRELIDQRHEKPGPDDVESRFQGGFWCGLGVE